MNNRNGKIHIPISRNGARADVQPVVIIGGGIAGLSAAWYLQQQHMPYVLLEASDRCGGLIQTKREHGLTMEFGPDAMITRKPWAYDLAQALGLQAEIIAVNDTPERIYVLSDEQFVPLPEGLRLLVPTKLMPFLRSPLLSPWGKCRVLLDWVIPPRRDHADESLAQFVKRRMGAEALDKLADPLLAGVYNAEMDRQSILATFPQYRALEAQHGSLIRGMQAQQRRATPSEEPALVSFKQGMGQLVEALVAQLTGTVRLNAPVMSIAPTETAYQVRLQSGDVFIAHQLILATPAPVSAQLLKEVAPDASRNLARIRYAGVGSISLAYRKRDVPRPLDAYGLVIPSSAGRNIDGMQWSSSKWPGRAQDHIALVRVFFGGPHTRHMLDKSDADILAIVKAELSALMGVREAPRYAQIGKWADAYPQYDVGHLDLVQQIDDALPAGIALAGNAYRGVGIPDTVKTAQQAVSRFVVREA